MVPETGDATNPLPPVMVCDIDWEKKRQLGVAFRIGTAVSLPNRDNDPERVTVKVKSAAAANGPSTKKAIGVTCDAPTWSMEAHAPDV